MVQAGYTAAIRAVGDNPFLHRTLDSLRSQTVPPSEVLVVVPAGTRPWETGHPAVRFVEAERGMVTQRAECIRSAGRRQVLLLDDDVVLEPRLAEVLLGAMDGAGAQCIVPYWTGLWPRKALSRLAYGFWGLAVPRRSGGIRYLRGGGYTYPLTPPPPTHWETHGGCGAVVLLDRDFAMEHDVLGFEELQRTSPWAVRDDAAMILEVVQKGGKALMVAGTGFEHLGGTTELMADRQLVRYRSNVFGHYLFWKRYLRPGQTGSAVARWMGIAGLMRYLAGIAFFGITTSVRARSVQPIRGYAQGLRLLLRDATGRSLDGG